MEWWLILIWGAYTLTHIFTFIIFANTNWMVFHFTEIKKYTDCNIIGIILIQLFYLLIVPIYVTCEMIYWLCHIKAGD